jgi:spore maturation protein SpmB
VPEPVPATGAVRFARAARAGALGGLKTTAWLVALVVPVSLAVTLLAWSGALEKIAGYVAPVLGLFGVPESTAIAFVTGALVNCYSAIAAFSAFPLTGREVTILALMILICHNLLVECPIQKRTGTSGVAMALLRIGGACVGGLALNLLMPDDPGGAAAAAEHGSGGALAAASVPLADALVAWAWSTGRLVLKIAVIVVSLTVVQKLLDAMGAIRLLSRVLYPAMWLLGLTRNVAFLWLVANTLGLAYGGGIIVEEARAGRLSRRDVNALNISVALCHSLLEDTILFVAVGASALWIIVPRLLMAGVAVWVYRLWERVAGDRAEPVAPEARA